MFRLFARFPSPYLFVAAPSAFCRRTRRIIRPSPPHNLRIISAAFQKTRNLTHPFCFFAFAFPLPPPPLPAAVSPPFVSFAVRSDGFPKQNEKRREESLRFSTEYNQRR